jgi:hypothetical protein
MYLFSHTNLDVIFAILIVLNYVGDYKEINKKANELYFTTIFSFNSINSSCNRC